MAPVEEILQIYVALKVEAFAANMYAVDELVIGPLTEEHKVSVAELWCRGVDGRQDWPIGNILIPLGYTN